MTGIADTPVRLAGVLTVAARATRQLGDYTEAAGLFNEAADLWDQAGNAEQAARARTMASDSGGKSPDEVL